MNSPIVLLAGIILRSLAHANSKEQAHSKGLIQQGWKDSHDSIFHADGSLAEAPVALCEVQGYVYAAKQAAARLSRMLGDVQRADALETAAAELQSKFEEAFWCEELSTYALALDGHKKACRVRASNAGHCLFTEIASADEALTAGVMPEERQACVDAGADEFLLKPAVRAELIEALERCRPGQR